MKRRILCEGWIEEGCEGGSDGLVFYPEVAGVVQKGKVWLARGKSAASFSLNQLAESLGMSASVALVESYDDLDLEERKLADGTTTKMPKGGRWFVEGPFQRSDVRNANKRVYPRSLWDKLVGDGKSYVMESVRSRGMVGHLEHPGDGRTDGKQGALVITDLKLKEDGVVWGRCELLDTPNGQILQEYTRKGVRWGVSSRGNGTVRDDGTVESDSYVLETWDAVMKPSVPGAYPTVSGSKVGEAQAVNTDISGKVTQITVESPDAVEYAAHVTSLVEMDFDSLDALGRANLIQNLIGAMDRGSTLVSSNLLPLEQASDLQGSLTQKLRTSIQAGGGSLDEAIDEAIRTVEKGEGTAHDGYDRVIGSLKQRLNDSVLESQSLRERLEVAESRSSALQGQCDEMVEQLANAERKQAGISAKLNLAEGLLATHPVASANGMVTAAVDEAIRQVPDLDGFRDVLEHARTPEAVNELAERLLPMAVHRVVETPLPARPEVPAVAAVSRTSLPTGIVESDDAGVLAPSVSAVSTLSRGVQLAAAVVGGSTR